MNALDLKPGDMLVANREKAPHVYPGTRYYSGLILKVHHDPTLTRWNGSPEIYMVVLWCDGYKSSEDVRRFLSYYEVISK